MSSATRSTATKFASEAAAGEDGYLVDKGLIPLQEEAFEANQDVISNLTVITADMLN